MVNLLVTGPSLVAVGLKRGGVLFSLSHLLYQGCVYPAFCSTFAYIHCKMRRFKIASFCTKLNPPKSGPKQVPEIDFSTKITIRKKLPCIMSLGCNIFIICLREKQFMFSNQYADKFRHKVCTLHHYFRILRLKIKLQQHR